MSEFPINARVILHGLVKGAQLNGQVGVVKSSLTDKGRQQVFLSGDEEKTVALRPSNLRYDPRPAGSLSVKEMKSVLSAKCVAKEQMTGVDKAQLVAMVTETTTPEEVAEILARANAPRKAQAAVARPASDRSSLDQQLRSQAEQMENMNPEQIRQQARMLRSMDPASIRRMNPQMAGMTDQQIRQAADQMDMMASNPSMMKMATEQIKNMTSADVEKVRAMQDQMGGGSQPSQPSAVAGATATGATASSSSSSSPPLNVSEDQLKTAAQQMQNMDPDQLRQQAAMIRSMDPASVRRMNPQMAGMTDEQIKMAANQMDMMASNPEMMKMAAEQMQSMSKEDMEELRKMQSQMGAAGAAGPAATGTGGGASSASPQPLDPASVDPSKMLDSMDPKQMKKMLEILKKNPAMMKQAVASNPAMAGMGEEQLGKALDAFASMDDQQFERAVGWMKSASKVSGAASTAWQRADGLVGGYLKQILICIGMFLVVSLLQRFGVIPSFGGAAGKAVSTATEAGISGVHDHSNEAVPVIDEQDEFAGEF